MTAKEYKDLTIQVKKTQKKRANTESDIQQLCVEWFNLQYPKLIIIAFPNGAFLHGDEKQRAQRWRRLEREGAISGAADLLLMVGRGDFLGLCIEFKTVTGKQTDKQKAFEEKVIAQGYGYVICRSFAQFEKIITSYLQKGEFE